MPGLNLDDKFNYDGWVRSRRSVLQCERSVLQSQLQSGRQRVRSLAPAVHYHLNLDDHVDHDEYLDKHDLDNHLDHDLDNTRTDDNDVDDDQYHDVDDNPSTLPGS